MEINLVRAQQRLKLLLERLLSMMRFLIANVSSHTINLRLADSERAVACLPTESASGLSFRPAR
jgi:hypothetical protein